MCQLALRLINVALASGYAKNQETATNWLTSRLTIQYYSKLDKVLVGFTSHSIKYLNNDIVNYCCSYYYIIVYLLGTSSAMCLMWVLMQEGTRGVHVLVAFGTTYIPRGYLIWQGCYTVTFGQCPTCRNRLQGGDISWPLAAVLVSSSSSNISARP